MSKDFAALITLLLVEGIANLMPIESDCLSFYSPRLLKCIKPVIKLSRDRILSLLFSLPTYRWGCVLVICPGSHCLSVSMAPTYAYNSHSNLPRSLGSPPMGGIPPPAPPPMPFITASCYFTLPPSSFSSSPCPAPSCP